MHRVEESSWRRTTGSLVVAALGVLVLLATAAPGLAHDPDEPAEDPPQEHVQGPDMSGYAVRISREYVRLGVGQNEISTELFRIYYDERGVAEGKIGDLGAGFENVTGLAFAPDGTLYAVDSLGGEEYRHGGNPGRLITIDPATGVGTAVGPLGVVVSDVGLTFDCDGNLWMATGSDASNPNDPSFYRVDRASGAATEVGPQGRPVSGLAANRNLVFGVGDGSLVTIDTSTGAATQVGSLADEAGSAGLAFSPDGALWGIGDGHIFTVDTNTGSARLHAAVETYGYANREYSSLAIPRGPLCSEPTRAIGSGSTASTSGASGGPTAPSDGRTVEGPPANQAGTETNDGGATVPSGGSGSWRVADRSPTGTGVAAGEPGGGGEVEAADPGVEMAASTSGAADSGDPRSGAPWVALVLAFVLAGLAALGAGGWSRLGLGR